MNASAIFTPEQLAHDWRVLDHAARSAEFHSARAATRRDRATGEAGGSGVVGAGLVSLKTSLHDEFLVNVAPSAVAERRVKRLKRSVWASGHLHGMTPNGMRPPRVWFVTLTYDTKGTLGKGRHDWKPDQISAALDKYRKWTRSVGAPCRYTWVAELQSRGTVHYHLLFWLPHQFNMPQWDRPHRLKSGAERTAFWPHGMSNTQLSTAGVGYLMKYLSKLGELTRFPKGLRLYGIGGLTAEAKAVRSWYNLPQWAKNEYGVGELMRKAGGLIVRETGEVLEPAYRAVMTGGGLLLKKLRETAERFHDGAYSRWSAAA